MSTTTGKTLNLVKPELTDDHKVTIGTDLPANFQKIDDAVSAHLAEKAADDVHGLKHKNILVELAVSQSIPNKTSTFVNFGIIKKRFGDAFSWNVENPTRVVVGAGVSKIKIRASVGWAQSETGNRQIDILRNGAVVFNPYLSQTVKPANTISTVSVGAVQAIYSSAIEVNEGDYFELRLHQNSGGALDVVEINGATSLYLEVVE